MSNIQQGKKCPMSNKELPMSKGALRLIAHVEIKRLKSYLP